MLKQISIGSDRLETSLQVVIKGIVTGLLCAATLLQVQNNNEVDGSHKRRFSVESSLVSLDLSCQEVAVKVGDSVT